MIIESRVDCDMVGIDATEEIDVDVPLFCLNGDALGDFIGDAAADHPLNFWDVLGVI